LTLKLHVSPSVSFGGYPNRWAEQLNSSPQQTKFVSNQTMIAATQIKVQQTS